MRAYATPLILFFHVGPHQSIPYPPSLRGSESSNLTLRGVNEAQREALARRYRKRLVQNPIYN